MNIIYTRERIIEEENHKYDNAARTGAEKRCQVVSSLTTTAGFHKQVRERMQCTTDIRTENNKNSNYCRRTHMNENIFSRLSKKNLLLDLV